MRKQLLRWTAIFLGWTVLGLFDASQTYITYLYSPGGRAYWAPSLKLGLAGWYVWGLLAPGIVRLARRFPLERGRWRVSLPVHVIAGALVALLKWRLDALVRHYVLGFAGTQALAFTLHLNLATYWMIVGASLGYDYYKRYREGELRASELAAQLSQAQLQALRMQLHPHFLFNTLNAISALVHRDPEAADRMIARLSELLRLTLEDMGVQEVPLRKELEFLERYLEIERTRFADRLTVEMEIAPETLDARTPYLILQPLVENAIRHGIAPRARAGRIGVRARRDNGMLRLEVSDNGPGITAGSPGDSRKGLGLASTRARLERLYGTAHRFEISNRPEGGLVVTLAIPFERAQTEPAGGEEAGAGQ